MPRHTKRVTITAPGRDKGKVFEVTEMAADQGERWASRAILAIANAGGRLPEGTLDAGLAGLEISWRNILTLGLQAFQGLSFRELEPLLDEMKPCFSWVPPGGPAMPSQPILPGDDSQVQEIRTWYTLRLAWIELHLGFSVAGELSTSGTEPAAATPAT